MKKSLVLAMAMALGVTASAYAANPFSDVPAGHWAYDSIDKLAAAGVIEGMGDGTYQGDKTMTRYEMAQIVAKAMAKGAQVDKLAAEFAEELDNLGVRVANLEKKADNVRITGLARYDYYSYKRSSSSKDEGAQTNNISRIRTDLTLTGVINEDWTYTALLRNQQFLSGASAGKGEEDVNFQRAYVEGRVGGVQVKAGRYSEFLESGLIYDNRVDALYVSYGRGVKISGAVGQSIGQKADAKTNMYYARVDAPVTKTVNAHVGYYKFANMDKVNDDDKILAVGVDAKLAKSMKFGATLLRSDVDKVTNTSGTYEIDKTGYALSLDYKGVNRKKPGSYGISAKYYNQPWGTYQVHTMDGYFAINEVGLKQDGFKGYMIGARYTLAANIVGGVDYYALKGRDGDAKNYDTIFTTLQFSF